MTSFELNGMRPLCFIGAGADAAPGGFVVSHEGSSFVPPHRDPDRVVVVLEPQHDHCTNLAASPLDHKTLGPP